MQDPSPWPSDAQPASGDRSADELAPGLKSRSHYWAVSEKLKGGFTLGTLMDDVIFQPREGSPGWEIVRHQNGGSNEMWACPSGRTLEEASATSLVDRFFSVEATGNIEAQLSWFAPRCKYYGMCWVLHAAIREAFEIRNRTRPGFHCRRQGPVTVQAGSHQR